MRYAISILFLMCFLVTVKGQHSPIYSQYLMDGLAINPAYAGSRDVLTTSLRVRKQWLNFPGSPLTQSLSAHMPLRNKSLAVGLLLSNEKIGVQNNISFFGNYAYRIRVNSGMLAFGLKAGFELFKENDSQLTLENPGDYVFSNNASYLLPNFGFGMYFSNAKYFLGVSIPELLSYREASKGLGYEFYNDPKNYNILLSGGYLFPVNEFLRIKPSTLLRYSINSTLQYDLNLNAILLRDASLWIGASYRVKDAVVGILEYQINTQLRTGLSYDYTLSALSKYSSGSVEFSVRYEFKYIVKALNPRFF